MKTCPFCAESIQDYAIVGRHCKRDLTTPKAENPVANSAHTLFAFGSGLQGCGCLMTLLVTLPILLFLFFLLL